MPTKYLVDTNGRGDNFYSLIQSESLS